MTVSELPRRRDDEPEGVAVAGQADAGPETITPRRRWFWQRAEGEQPHRLVDGDDLERLTENLYRFGARFSQPSPQESALRARISVATRELEVLAATKTARKQAWAKAAAALLADARDALEAGLAVDGWQLLRAAERHMIEGRTPDDLVDDLAVTRRRLDELAPGAAAALPARPAKDPGAVRSAALRARAMLDDYLDEFERLVHQKARMIGHGAILLAATLVLVGFAVLIDLPVDVGGTVLAGIGTYVTIVSLGMAGAVISRAVSGERDDGYVVQASLNPVLVHVLRIALGGAAALVVMLYLQSGIQGLIDATGVSAYPFALAAGLSERLVDRVFARTQDSCEASAARALGANAA